MNREDQIRVLLIENGRLHKRVERQERRLRILTAGIVALPIAFLMMGSVQDDTDVPQLVRAKRFELVDADGKVRAVLGNENGIDGLTILDPSGKTSARVTAPIGTGLFEVVDENKSRVLLGSQAGLPFLRFNDDKEKRRAVLRLEGPNQTPQLLLQDEQGNFVFVAP